MGQPYFEDVTDRAEGEAPFPAVTAVLEDRGWRVLGRIAQRHVPGSRLAYDRWERDRLTAWAARPPGTLLASGDRTAYAVVDAYGDAPVLRLRTLLDDGAVVETISVAGHGVLRPRGQDPFAGFTLADAQGRSVALLRDVPVGDAVDTHARRVGDESASRAATPVDHGSREAALALWNDLTGHTLAAASALARRTRLLSLGLTALAVVVVLSVAGALSSALALGPGWDLVLHLAVACLVLAVLVPALRWSGARVRETRGWRPAYSTAGRSGG